MDEGNDARSKEVVRLWRAWRTAHEMIADREYELAEDEIKISLDRFRSDYCNPDGSVNRGKLQFSARPSDAMLRKNTPQRPTPTPIPPPTAAPSGSSSSATRPSASVRSATSPSTSSPTSTRRES
ncbi:hypothetical protein V2G26_006526 [Clonostachys chloroleuca]